MAISTELKYASLGELFLDPHNPRLGRNNTGENVNQEEVLELMKDWTLDELAVSFLESGGFWPQEALIVVKEKLYGSEKLIVIEGNRRLAALKLLNDAYQKKPISTKWADIIKGRKPVNDLFIKIPYLLASSRDDVDSFLGFRHVTGIKEWRPAEKAQFIAKLIDERGLSYEQVRRKIGSKAATVRQNYISYRLLLQIEQNAKGIPKENFEERFSVMYLSLRTQGVKQFLQIDIMADPPKAKLPVPKKHLKSLSNFALWLFGNDKTPPLFTDSRLIDDFGKLLESKEAISYLERTDRPKFEVAFQIAGGDEPEIIRLIETAADNIELALSRVHLFKKSKKINKAVERLGVDTLQILKIFPDIKKGIFEEND
ncbi:MAG TPA: hypothetical protein PLL26_05825 [Candidatus Dojkabacteria bacterium]|nr:hypothetical protein [Candidatus Dojkabacteria bacterium]